MDGEQFLKKPFMIGVNLSPNSFSKVVSFPTLRRFGQNYDEYINAIKMNVLLHHLT